MEDDGSRVAMDHEVTAIVGHRVVRYAAEGLCVLEGGDVCDALGVIPDPSIPPEVSGYVDRSFAPIGADCDGFVDALDVGQEVAIAEDVDRGLVVEENPEAVEDACVGLSETVVLPDVAQRVSPSGWGECALLVERRRGGCTGIRQ